MVDYYSDSDDEYDTDSDSEIIPWEPMFQPGQDELYKSFYDKTGDGRDLICTKVGKKWIVHPDRYRVYPKNYNTSGMMWLTKEQINLYSDLFHENIFYGQSHREYILRGEILNFRKNKSKIWKDVMTELAMAVCVS